MSKRKVHWVHTWGNEVACMKEPSYMVACTTDKSKVTCSRCLKVMERKDDEP